MVNIYCIYKICHVYSNKLHGIAWKVRRTLDTEAGKKKPHNVLYVMLNLQEDMNDFEFYHSKVLHSL